MNSRLLLGTLAAASLVVAACGSDDDRAADDTADDTTEPDAAQPTTAPTTEPESTDTATTEPATTESEGDDASDEATDDITGAAVNELIADLQADPGIELVERGCWYRRGLLLTEEQIPDGSDSDLAVLADPGDHGYEAAGGLEGPFLYTIPDDVDPLAVAVQLQDKGFVASPVLMAAFSVHWGYAPGTDPEPQSVPADTLVMDAPNGEIEARVAVLDTGFLDQRWHGGRVEAASDGFVDVEHLDEPGVEIGGAEAHGSPMPEDLRSHGMFVASLILRQQPATQIVIARVGNTHVSEFEPDDNWTRRKFWDDHLAAAHDAVLTDELQMYFAVRRLIAHDADGEGFDALNVSMGAYECETLDRSGLGIRAALRLWNDKYPDAPVVAAAGNHNGGDDTTATDDGSGSEDTTATDDGSGSEPAAADADAPIDYFLPAGFDHPDRPAERQLDPAEYPTIHSIAALSYDGVPAEYSNVGSHLVPGHRLVGIRSDEEVVAWGGTSFATALASAVIAHQGAIEDAEALDVTDLQLDKNS